MIAHKLQNSLGLISRRYNYWKKFRPRGLSLEVQQVVFEFAQRPVLWYYASISCQLLLSSVLLHPPMEDTFVLTRFCAFIIIKKTLRSIKSHQESLFTLISLNSSISP